MASFGIPNTYKIGIKQHKELQKLVGTFFPSFSEFVRFSILHYVKLLDSNDDFRKSLNLMSERSFFNENTIQVCFRISKFQHDKLEHYTKEFNTTKSNLIRTFLMMFTEEYSDYLKNEEMVVNKNEN